MGQWRPSRLTFRGAFEALENVECSGRANNGVKGKATAANAGESVYLKDAPKQICPCVPSGLSLRGRLAQPFSRLRFGWLWNHLVPMAVPRGKDTVVRHAVLPARRHECGQLLRQFHRAKDEVAGPVGVRLSQGENEQPVRASMQSRPCQWWPQHVTAQSFQTFSVALPNDDGGVQVLGRTGLTPGPRRRAEAIGMGGQIPAAVGVPSRQRERPGQRES